MKEFENLVSRTHRAGLKVIIDFVPNHVARNTIRMHNLTAPLSWEPMMILTTLLVRTIISTIFRNRELHGQFDMKGNALEPYHEFPAKATGK